MSRVFNSFPDVSFTATNSMKPPAFDIGYGVYRSFYFTEYVPPPPVKTNQTSKDLSQMDDEEPSNYNYIIIYYNVARDTAGWHLYGEWE